MKTNDERLRDVLRGADPAAGEPGLAPEEIQAMRRAVLTSVPEPRRRWVPIAALAGSALAVLLLALMLLSPDAEGPAKPPRQPARMAEKPKTAPVPVRPPAPEPAVQKPEKPREMRAPRKRPAPESTPAVIADTAPAPPPEEPEVEATIAAETRQIQFSTPGGTRIIWVLTSDGTSN
ncbi:MAG TPA: hypothetical protein VIW92_03430 [Thermoanaerobaculia bacterium]